MLHLPPPRPFDRHVIHCSIPDNRMRMVPLVLDHCCTLHTPLVGAQTVLFLGSLGSYVADGLLGKRGVVLLYPFVFRPLWKLKSRNRS